MTKSRGAGVTSVAQRSLSGFWLYLMTDSILFASLFATYVVLKPGTAGGPGPEDIFQLPMILVSTIILLTSSLTAGLALLAAKQKSFKTLIIWLAATYVLGVAFVSIEAYEFMHILAEGHSWQTSAFLSGFFVLVGTHGLHIIIGLIWLLVLLCVLVQKGLTPKVQRQLESFGLYWHFLDLIWIFIFTVVYLMGVV